MDMGPWLKLSQNQKALRALGRLQQDLGKGLGPKGHDLQIFNHDVAYFSGSKY